MLLVVGRSRGRKEENKKRGCWEMEKEPWEEEPERKGEWR